LPTRLPTTHSPKCRGMLVVPRFAFVKPALPMTTESPPRGPEWVHEIKHDGYRMTARRDAAGVRLLTRNGYDCAQ
jgi:ATP-dependent DNA ligase